MFTSLLSKRFRPAAVFSTATLALAGLALVASPAQAVSLIALTTANQLYSFDSAAPNTATLLGTVNLGGTGATALGIDYRADGTLYALGSNGFIYTLNGITGTQFSDALVPPSGSVITDSNYTIDFNPVPNALRVINRNGQNLRITNSAGTNNLSNLIEEAAQSPNGNYPAGVAVVGTAYTNTDTNPATGTQQYVIDDTTDSLILVNQPNTPSAAGGLTTVGALGVAVNGPVGFDIYFNGTGNTGYFANGTTLYTVDLTTGAAGTGTTIGGGNGIGTVRGLTAQVAAAPEPGSIALVGTGFLSVAGMVVRRRRAA